MTKGIFSMIALGFMPSLVCAQYPSIPQCPDKAIKVVKETSPTDPNDAFLIFRRTSTGKKVGSFSLGGFSTYALLLWSPDGRYAAVQTHYGKHTMELFVFRVGTDGIQQVKIQDYHQNIYGRAGVLHGGRGSIDQPLKWLSEDRLLISSKGSLTDSEDSNGYDYEVEIQIIPEAADLVGWLGKITPAEKHP